MRQATGAQQVRFAALGRRVSLGAGAAIALLAAPADAAMLTEWAFDPATQQLEVTVPEGTTPRYFLLAQPARIVLDLPGTQVGAVPAQQSYSGAVRQIRVGQFDAELTRIVIELSPDAVLAPEQVELRQSAPAEARWVLRPLLVGASNPTTAARPAASPQPPIASPPTPPTPEPTTAAPTLPPLEPNALEIPIAPPTNPPPTPASSAPETSVAAQPAAPLPPARQPVQPAPSVTVPPLQPRTPPAAAPSPTPRVSVPPPASPRPAAGRADLEFGQPLPSAPAQVAIAAPVLLSRGTVLRLRYPRDVALALQADTPRQEVLLLQQPVRDEAGNVLFPADSEVVGRFESTSSGSRFVAQAISLQGRNLRIQAESDPLAGDRELIPEDLLGNSAIGALALGIIGGFSGLGLLGGALVGVGTTYLISPQPATIQPNQIVEVRVLEDVPRVR